jgi:hypothetical protein
MSIGRIRLAEKKGREFSLDHWQHFHHTLQAGDKSDHHQVIRKGEVGGQSGAATQVKLLHGAGSQGTSAKIQRFGLRPDLCRQSIKSFERV